MTDDLDRWIKPIPGEPTTTVYVQPGGCVEIRQSPPHCQPEDAADEMVHICDTDWDAAVRIVAELRANRNADRYDRGH